ncbi:MAG TPA: sigma-70 family RNA polymerase sigma factor [Bacilli bacterium]|nr:sigma-70 family RNA polymerase sigma factor [Bacilli bacterium]
MEGIATMSEHPVTPPTFQHVFRAYYPQVVRQVLRILGDAAAAEDVAQDVFLQLYDQEWRTIDNVGGWLHQASIYAAYKYVRSERRRSSRDERGAEPGPSVEPSTEERWLQQEEITAVREALTDLGERDRALLLLKYAGYGYRELAEITQVESGSVGTLLARARKKFRDLYQRRRGMES